MTNGIWTDYIYANGRKLAKVDAADTRVHLTGVNNPTSDSGRWTVGVLPVPSNATVLPGDTLTFRLYENNAPQARISVGFTDGSNSDWFCSPCYDPAPEAGQWQNVAINFGGSVSSPGPMAGKTVSYFFMGDVQGGPNGEWDVMIADIALVLPNGSVTTFPMPLGSVPWRRHDRCQQHLLCQREGVGVQRRCRRYL